MTNNVVFCEVGAYGGEQCLSSVRNVVVVSGEPVGLCDRHYAITKEIFGPGFVTDKPREVPHL